MPPTTPTASGSSGPEPITPPIVQALLEGAGARVIAWYGVRLFTDHFDRDVVITDLESVIAAEEQAGQRDPYRTVAALTHTLATVE